MKKNNYKSFYNINKHQGFTLVELMTAVVIISIIAAVSLPAYDEYNRRGILSQTQQEILKVADQLERHKARNFSYMGFNAEYLYPNLSEFKKSDQTLSFPVAKDKKFEISIVDNAGVLLTNSSSLGQGWAIKAISEDPRNYNLLLTSNGIKCKTKSKLESYSSCQDGLDW